MTTLNNTETAATVFARMYDAAKPIAFDTTWNNGTGYLDHFTKAKLADDRAVCFVTDDGRRAVGIPTTKGNVVFFERYVNDNQTLTSNKPRALDVNEPRRYNTVDDILGFIESIMEA